MYFILLLLINFSVDSASLDLNKQNLLETIKNCNIDHPDIVYAQAMLESGNLKSKLVKTNNNLFGMRKPKIRKTTATESKYKYAKYDHWTSSVEDYKLWQDYLFRKKRMTRKEYLKYLQIRYSETPNYINRVMKIVNQNKI
jgi:hypothetical protein